MRSSHSGANRAGPFANSTNVGVVSMSVDVPFSQTKPLLTMRTTLVEPPGNENAKGSASVA